MIGVLLRGALSLFAAMLLGLGIAEIVPGLPGIMLAVLVAILVGAGSRRWTLTGRG